jgi:hypothetical protein
MWDAIVEKVKRSDGEDLVDGAIFLFLCVLGPLLLLLGIFILEMQRILMGCEGG